MIRKTERLVRENCGVEAAECDQGARIGYVRLLPESLHQSELQVYLEEELGALLQRTADARCRCVMSH